MFIEITALIKPNATFVQDFQALVTDHENKASDGCTATIGVGFNVGWDNQNPRWYNITFKGSNCITVLHAVDLTNNPRITSYLDFPYQQAAGSGLQVYKNLKIVDNNKLISNVIPITITDRNVLIVRKNPINLYYSWGYLNPSVTYTNINFAQLGSIMTTDYLSFLPSYLQSSVTQVFRFAPSQLRSFANDSSTSATIEFSIQKSIGNSKLSIKTTDNKANQLTTKEVRGSDNFPMTFNMTGFNIQFVYSNILVPYQNPTGLYATYKLKSIQSSQTHTIVETSTKSSSYLNIISTISLSILMIFV